MKCAGPLALSRRSSKAAMSSTALALPGPRTISTPALRPVARTDDASAASARMSTCQRKVMAREDESLRVPGVGPFGCGGMRRRHRVVDGGAISGQHLVEQLADSLGLLRLE